MRQIRKKVTIDKLERKLLKIERRIIKLSTLKYQLQDLIDHMKKASKVASGPSSSASEV